MAEVMDKSDLHAALEEVLENEYLEEEEAISEAISLIKRGHEKADTLRFLFNATVK